MALNAAEQQKVVILSDAYRALACLHIAVESSVADDACAKVHAALTLLEGQIQEDGEHWQRAENDLAASQSEAQSLRQQVADQAASLTALKAEAQKFCDAREAEFDRLREAEADVTALREQLAEALRINSALEGHLKGRSDALEQAWAEQARLKEQFAQLHEAKHTQERHSSTAIEAANEVIAQLEAERAALGPLIQSWRKWITGPYRKSISAEKAVLRCADELDTLLRSRVVP